MYYVKRYVGYCCTELFYVIIPTYLASLAVPLHHKLGHMCISLSDTFRYTQLRLMSFTLSFLSYVSYIVWASDCDCYCATVACLVNRRRQGVGSVDGKAVAGWGEHFHHHVSSNHVQCCKITTTPLSLYRHTTHNYRCYQTVSWGDP